MLEAEIYTNDGTLDAELLGVIGSSKGIENYEELKNKPKINGVELVGNKTANDLNLQEKGNYIQDNNYVHTDNNYTNSEKNKLANLKNYDDTDLVNQISQVNELAEQNERDITNLGNESTTIKDDIEEIETALNYLVDKKQDNLIAGENIKIENNVISSDSSKTFLGFVDDHTSNDTAFDLTGFKKGIYTFGRNTTAQRTLYLKVNINGVDKFVSHSIERNYKQRPITLVLYDDIENLETKSGSLYNLNYFVIDETGYSIKLQYYNCSISNSNLTTSASSYTINAVGQSNTQTISGLKTFTKLPQTTLTPTDDKDFTTKKYVDDAIKTAIIDELGSDF